MIKLVIAFEFLAYATGMVMIITQIAIPIAFNSPLFPLFRKKARAVENEMAHLNERVEISERKRQISKTKDRLARN